jgi:hypothetical protein
VESTKVTGGCLCGAIRYNAEAFLEIVYYCHCRSCQRSTGQPAEIGVLIKSGTLTYSGSEPKYYDSSEFGQRGFCSECGSRLVWRSRDPADDWALNVSVGSLDKPELARPRLHMFVDEKISWYDPQDDLPHTTSDEADAIADRWKDSVS